MAAAIRRLRMRQTAARLVHKAHAGRATQVQLRRLAALLRAEPMRDLPSLRWLSWLLRERPELEAESHESMRVLQRLVLLGDAGAMVELSCRIEKRDRASRRKLLDRAIALGNANAMVSLAGDLLEGNDQAPARDRARAERLLQRAAALGDAWAMQCLGWKRDFVDRGTRSKEAAHWYARAARRGISEGMYNYAICREDGLGVRRDLRLARKWLARAAERGDRDAKDRLALLRRKRLRLLRATR